MLLIDAHLDLSTNALFWNRDLNLSVSEIRAAESGMTEKGRGANTVSLLELRKAEVGICLATVIARANPDGRSDLDYRTQDISYAVAQGQRAYYRLLETQGKMRQLRSAADFQNHLAEWRSGDRNTVPLGYVLSMEGADPVVDPQQLESWYDDGLRVLSLSHYGLSSYAHGTGVAGGVTSRGPELLREMDRLGVVLDVTHLADQAFWEAMDIFPGRVLASHNNCRSLVPGDRQFSDDQILRLVEREAVIGVALDAWMLEPSWVYGKTPRERVRLDSVANQIDHICQLAGNTRHAAIGSDLDGGYGTEQCPADLDTIADLQNLPALLEQRGFSSSDIVNVMHGNWIRFFDKALP